MVSIRVSLTIGERRRSEEAVKGELDAGDRFELMESEGISSK